MLLLHEAAAPAAFAVGTPVFVRRHGAAVVLSDIAGPGHPHQGRQQARVYVLPSAA